eukprot:12172556-Ditylum_brightwellii.AAC.2
MLLHEQFFVQHAKIQQMDANQSTHWLTKVHLRVKMEAVMCTTMEQTLATNKVKRCIFKLAVSPLCCLCNEKEESVYHIVCNFTPLSSTKYLPRHNEHKLLTAIKIDRLEITWDYAWDTEGTKIVNKSDIVMIDKIAKMGQLIDVVVLYDTNIVATTAEKITKYRALELHLKND